MKIVQIRNFELQYLRQCYGVVAGASLETEAPSILKRSILIHELVISLLAFFCNGEVSVNYKKRFFYLWIRKSES